LAAVFALGASLLITQNRKLVEKTTLLELTFENMSQGLCMFDARQRLVVCNRHYAEMYGLTPEQTKPGTPLSAILEARVVAGRCPRDARSYVEKRLDEVSSSEPYYKIDELQDGRVIAITHQPRNDGGWVAVHQDITAQMRIEAKIVHMARHDELTDVGNRAFFMEKINEALARLRRTDEAFAILMIDLDGFKGVNDSLGHPVGDELLKAVAKRLQASIRETDTVARLGGDEFVILQTRVSDHKNNAAILANRILQAIGAPYDLDGPEVSIGVSIGVALAPEDGFGARQLLKNADLAMYTPTH
jgi:diguanylate cyclase (GGDEF)-like protein